MHFLLVFFAFDTADWRVLDTRTVRGLNALNIDDLINELRRHDTVLQGWMMGRYDVLGPVSDISKARRGTELAEVYQVTTEAPIIGSSAEYRGPWLEIFRQVSAPDTYLEVRKTSNRSATEAFQMLGKRVADPLAVSSDACRETIGKMTQKTLRHQRQTAAPHSEMTPSRRELKENT